MGVDQLQKAYNHHRRVHHAIDRLLDWALRVVPLGALVAVGAFVAAQQAVSPQRRMVKLGVLVGLLTLMFRFPMLWSVFLFTILFPFPSGISIGSTNLVLMTLIPMIWAVRASSEQLRLFNPTPLDAGIAIMTLGYVLSFFNVAGTHDLVLGLRVLWRHLALLGYFYLIVRFVDSEEKMIRMLKAVCIMSGLVMSTAVVELLFPGRSIIPGWISVSEIHGQGSLSFRLEKIRVGGAVASHAMLSDLASNTIWLMVYLANRARNPIEKTFWLGVSALTLVALLSSGNRGALIGLFVGFIWFLYIMRRQIRPVRMLLLVLVAAASTVAAQIVLDRYTYAASVTQRLMGTELEGWVPENRVRTWAPALEKALEHPLIGHGPHYDIGIGLSAQLWPHNGYLYYFYTIGLIGLFGFMWILFRATRESFLYRRPELQGTTVATVLKLLQVWLLISCIGQLRTDHQRDDVYPFIIWLMLGLIVAAGSIARKQLSTTRGGTVDT